MLKSSVDRVAEATPHAIARRMHGLSDRALAWLFVAPSIVLLLAVNIFPHHLDDPVEPSPISGSTGPMPRSNSSASRTT